MQLWDFLSDEGGEEQFVEWLCKLFQENGSRATTHFAENEGVVYLRSGTVKVSFSASNLVYFAFRYLAFSFSFFKKMLYFDLI